MIFGVPVALASMVPVFPHAVGQNALFSPVLIRDRATKRILHYREAYELGMFDFLRAPQWKDPRYDEEGFDVIQNSPEDIRDLTLDMVDQLNGIAPSDEARALQAIYRNEYANDGDSFEFAPTIAPRFALKYRDLIENS
jgi:putative glycosyltransferase (TIGR04372 family)